MGPPVQVVQDMFKSRPCSGHGTNTALSPPDRNVLAFPKSRFFVNYILYVNSLVWSLTKKRDLGKASTSRSGGEGAVFVQCPEHGRLLDMSWTPVRVGQCAVFFAANGASGWISKHAVEQSVVKQGHLVILHIADVIADVVVILP